MMTETAERPLSSATKRQSSSGDGTASCQHVGPRGSAVERQSLASLLSPSCVRPVADG